MREQPADHGGWFYASYPSCNPEDLRLSLTSPLVSGRTLVQESAIQHELVDSHRSRGSWYEPHGSSL